MPQLRVRRRNDEVVVSVCDSELFGKKLKEGNLSLEVDREFYEGEEASVEECLEALENATIANLVGSIIEHAIEADYINPDRVLEIENVPHAQMASI